MRMAAAAPIAVPILLPVDLIIMPMAVPEIIVVGIPSEEVREIMPTPDQ